MNAPQGDLRIAKDHNIHKQNSGFAAAFQCKCCPGYAQKVGSHKVYLYLTEFSFLSPDDLTHPAESGGSPDGELALIVLQDGHHCKMHVFARSQCAAGTRQPGHRAPTMSASYARQPEKNSVSSSTLAQPSTIDDDLMRTQPQGDVQTCSITKHMSNGLRCRNSRKSSKLVRNIHGCARHLKCCHTLFMTMKLTVFSSGYLYSQNQMLYPSGSKPSKCCMQEATFYSDFSYVFVPCSAQVRQGRLTVMHVKATV